MSILPTFWVSTPTSTGLIVLTQHLFLYAGYHFSRLRTLVRPEFANKQNISGAAGISGNDQDSGELGTSGASFSSGIAALSDAQSTFNRNRTDGYSASIGMYRGHHNITIGGDLRKQQFNDYFQQDPRGSFTFTGAVTGSDFADFLTGVPDTSSIAFGNADKYFRQTVYDAYATDDWRVMPILTINAGDALGIRCADDGVERSPRESRCGIGICAGGTSARFESGRAP